MVEVRKEATSSLNLDANAAMPKERRVGAINAWAGTAKQLVEASKSGTLKVYDRAFAQGWACALVMGGHVQLFNVSDGVVLVHSAQGCCIRLLQRYGSSQFWYPKDKTDTAGVVFAPGQVARWYGTNLTEEDVIFGGENKLRETIKMIDRKHHPKSIFITNSCAAGIMGDDIEGVAKSIQPQVGAIIVPVRCEPVQSRICQHGHDAFGHALLKYLVREPRTKQKDLVNLLSTGGEGIDWRDRVHLSQLLAKAGIRTNVAPGWCTTEQIQTLSEAAGSTALCPTFTDYLIKGLNQKYGVPYFRDTVPFGIAETGEWLRKVAQFVGKEKEIEDVIKEEQAAVMPQVKALREQLQGTKVFLAGGQTRTLFLPMMLIQDFGMELVGVNIFHWDEPAVEDLEKLGRIVGNMDFFVHIGDNQNFETINYIKKMDVDLVLAHPGGSGTFVKLGRPTVGRIFAEWHRARRCAGFQMGYEGIASYGKYLLRLIKNPSFGKTLSTPVSPYQESVLPYKKSWYESDAFSKFKELE